MTRYSSFLLLLLLCSCDQLWRKHIDDKVNRNTEQTASTVTIRQATIDSLYRLNGSNLSLQQLRQLSDSAEESVTSYALRLAEYVATEKLPINEVERQEAFSIDGGEARQLEIALNNYISNVNALDNAFNFDKIAKGEAEMEGFSGNRSFVEFTFSDISPAFAAAILKELQLEVLNVELEAMKKLHQQ